MTTTTPIQSLLTDFDIASKLNELHGHIYKCNSLHPEHWLKLCDNDWISIQQPRDEIYHLIDNLNIKGMYQLRKRAIMNEFAIIVYRPEQVLSKDGTTKM
jgi:hypothetical protein